ncbi:MAG: adenylate/guanylate cyclase domain-containing protein [Terrimicrobiaceae bacterium]
MQPPTGTVTFLFTDIEGSSRLWERFPVDMGPALARHDTLLRTEIESRGGFIFKTVGDAFCAAFATPEQCLEAALGAQERLFAEDWGKVGPLRVRMGLHTGRAEFRDNDYFGGTLNRTARISSAGHGGQVLCSQAVADLLREAMPQGSFVALGDFRLRNLNRVERIYQVHARGLPASFPPLRSQQNLPHNLPARQTSFIGRAAELEQVKELLGKTRMLTLLGTGGTGKTRLALEAGRELLDDYPDGVWLVELATLEKDSSFEDAVAGALGVREEPGRSLGETLADFLCGREMLLVLDNCEHVLDSVCRSVAALLARCKKAAVLATSRQALHVPGEVTFPVRPLEAFDVWQRPRDRPLSADDVAGFDAVKLFVDRAQAVVPDFRLTDENAPDIARICWRLDGIPLALELAAARLRVLTSAQISDRLNDRFRLLKGKAVLPHQQTLRALIDWSYDLLAGPEKLLFHRLGVFAGGRTIEAVEAVCMDDEADDVLDLLQQLAEKSLLFIDQAPSSEPRYTLLESVWQYAREKLKESGEMEAMQERHLEYYRQLVLDAGPHLAGPDPEKHLRKLASDSLNLRYALEWAAERPGGAEPGLQLVAGLERYWEICGNLEEARRHCEAVLARTDCVGSPRSHAQALMSAGRVAWAQDRYGDGLALLGRALGIFEGLGDEEQAGFAGGYEGFLAFSQGNKDLARQLFLKAAGIGERTGNRRLQALAVAGEGSLAAGEGNHELAFELKSEALKMFREVGDRWIVGYSLWGFAQMSLALGRPAPARDALAEWALTARDLGNRWAIPYIVQHLADAARLEGRLDLAARLFGAAELLREKYGIRFSPSEREVCEAAVAALKSLMDDEAFRAHWKAGRHLRPDAALEIALAG